MIHTLRLVDDALAFVLELAVYASLVRYALTRRVSRALRWSAALALVALAAVAWALFGAPGAVVPLHGAARGVLDLLWFGAGAAALHRAGHRRAALAFVALYALTTGAHLLL